MEQKEVWREEMQATQAEANKVIKNHVLGSMGIGLIPVPLVDLVALTGVQLNMIRKLAELYDIPFAKDRGKHLIASLVGGSVPVSLGGMMGSLIKAIPIVGQTTGALAMPAVAGATTYALGKVFVQHFASGGTFLNFDPEQVRDYYARMCEEGQAVAEELKKNGAAAASNASARMTQQMREKIAEKLKKNGATEKNGAPKTS